MWNLEKGTHYSTKVHLNEKEFGYVDYGFYDAGDTAENGRVVNILF